MKRLLTNLAILATISSAASAQDITREDGPYFRVGAGVTAVSDWNQDFTTNPTAVFPAGPLATSQTLINGNGFTAGAALGFDYADGIRTELEYRYASASIDSFAAQGGIRPGLPTPPVNDSLSAHLLMSNFYFDFYNDSPITPFIGGGVGGASVTNENGDSDAALAYQGRVGLSFALGGGFSADMEYIYLRTNKLVYGPADDEFIAGGPPVRLDGESFESSSAMISLRKPF